MCIAVPMRVVSSNGPMAHCVDADGREAVIDLALVGAVREGDWLLTFLGAARELIDAARAASINLALGALAAAMRGDAAMIDAAFADLIDREPRLPEFLRGPPKP